MAENENLRSNHFKPRGISIGKDFLKRRTFALACNTVKSYEQSAAEKMLSYQYSFTSLRKESRKLFK